MEARPYITFYIPSDQIIPTDLRLKVGSVHILYERIPFGYKFTVYKSDDEKAKQIVDEVIRQMIIDSDGPETGTSLVSVSIKEIPHAWSGAHAYEWIYRVRDSY